MILNHLCMRMVMESKKSIYIRVILPIYKNALKSAVRSTKKLRKIENMLNGMFINRIHLLVLSLSDPSKNLFSTHPSENRAWFDPWIWPLSSSVKSKIRRPFRDIQFLKSWKRDLKLDSSVVTWFCKTNLWATSIWESERSIF